MNRSCGERRALARRRWHNPAVPAPRLSFVLVFAAWSIAAVLLTALSRIVATGTESIPVDLAWAGVLTALVVLLRWPGAAVLCGGGVLAALDLYAFDVANQGLSSLVDIAREEGLPALAMVLDESGIGAVQIGGMFAGCLIFGGLSGCLWRRLATRQVGWGRFLAAMSVALVVAVALDPGLAVPRITGHFWGQDRLIAGEVARRGELPRIQLPAGGLPAPHTDLPLPRDGRYAATRVLVFVVEALRADAIDAVVTPNIARFAAGSSRWLDARSAGDATHPGWYSILYGRWGLHWYRLRHRGGAGPNGMSPGLAELQRHGGVGLYSGARLDFYELSGVALGRPAPSDPPAPDFIDARACHAAGAVRRSDCDVCAVDHFLVALKAAKLPSTNFIFFDGTHVPYDWPAGHEPRFTPVSDPDLLRHGDLGAHGVAGLKNRYRSALHAVDVQFGRILDALDERADADRTLIILTGDHGEEFLEHGRLTHASEPCALQSRVPILIRGPGFAASERRGMAAHADILPTILFALRDRATFALRDGATTSEPVPLDGAPLQIAKAREFGLVVHTGATPPSLFALHRGEHVLRLAFADRAPPESARALLVVDDWPRERIADVFGDALHTVFGVDRAAIMAHRPDQSGR